MCSKRYWHFNNVMIAELILLFHGFFFATLLLLYCSVCNIDIVLNWSFCHPQIRVEILTPSRMVLGREAFGW